MAAPDSSMSRGSSPQTALPDHDASRAQRERVEASDRNGPGEPVLAYLFKNIIRGKYLVQEEIEVPSRQSRAAAGLAPAAPGSRIILGWDVREAAYDCTFFTASKLKAGAPGSAVIRSWSWRLSSPLRSFSLNGSSR